MVKKYFSGEVVLTTLPVVTTAGNIPAPVRLQLQKGELGVILDNVPFLYLATVEFLPKVPRGNHIHPAKRQWMYVLQGSLEGVIQARDSKEQISINMTTGDLIEIAPGIAHAFVSPTGALAVETADKPWQEGDTLPVELIKEHVS